MPLFAGMAVVLVGPRVQVSTQVNPDKAKPEPRAFRILWPEILVPSDLRG